MAQAEEGVRDAVMGCCGVLAGGRWAGCVQPWGAPGRASWRPLPRPVDPVAGARVHSSKGWVTDAAGVGSCCQGLQLLQARPPAARLPGCSHRHLRNPQGNRSKLLSGHGERVRPKQPWSPLRRAMGGRRPLCPWLSSCEEGRAIRMGAVSRGAIRLWGLLGPPRPQAWSPHKTLSPASHCFSASCEAWPHSRPRVCLCWL